MMEELEIRERIGTESRQWHYNKTENTKKGTRELRSLTINLQYKLPDISGANKE